MYILIFKVHTTLEGLLIQFKECHHLSLLLRDASRVGILAQKLHDLILLVVAAVVDGSLVLLGVGEDHQGGIRGDVELGYHFCLGVSNLPKHQFALEVLRQDLEQWGCGLLVAEQDQLVLGGFLRNEGLIVLRGDDLDETLHLTDGQLGDVLQLPITTVLHGFVSAVGWVTLHTRMFKGLELILTQFFLVATVDSCHPKYTIEFGCQVPPNILVLFALLVLLEEENDPDFIASQELGQVSQINLVHITLLEEATNLVVLVTALVELLEVVLLVGVLLLILESLFAMMVVDVSLLLVLQDLIGVDDLGEHFLSALLLALILVRVVLDRELLEGLL